MRVHTGFWMVLVLDPVSAQLYVTWEKSVTLSKSQLTQQKYGRVVIVRLLVVTELYTSSEPKTIQK